MGGGAYARPYRRVPARARAARPDLFAHHCDCADLHTHHLLARDPWGVGSEDPGTATSGTRCPGRGGTDGRLLDGHEALSFFHAQIGRVGLALLRLARNASWGDPFPG